MPLTAAKVVPEELVGGGRVPARAPTVDQAATRVLIKGEPIEAPSGRADDFSWPRGSTVTAAPEPVAEPAPAAAPTAATTPPAAAKSAKSATTAQPTQRRPRANSDAPRPLMPLQGFFRF